MLYLQVTEQNCLLTDIAFPLNLKFILQIYLHFSSFPQWYFFLEINDFCSHVTKYVRRSRVNGFYTFSKPRSTGSTHSTRSSGADFIKANIQQV